MNHLNNDQRLRKAHKNVQNLGTIASTILAFELQLIIKERISQIKDVIKQNESATASEPTKTELINVDGESFLKTTKTDFKACSDFVKMGLATNESTLKVLYTFNNLIDSKNYKD